MADITDILDRIQAEADAAEKGPWMVRPGRDGRQNQEIQGADIVATDFPDRAVASLHISVWKPGHRDARPTANFTAHARTNVPRLVAALEVADRAMVEARRCCENGDEFDADWWRGEIQAILEGRDDVS